MKKIIWFVCFLVSFVLLFVIVQQKVFYSGKGIVLREGFVIKKKTESSISSSRQQKTTAIQSKQELGTTAPAISEQTDKQVAGDRTATNPVPIETEFVAEIKTIEAKPTAPEEKSNGTKSIETESIVKDKSASGKETVPAAIPIFSPDEAKKANEFARFVSTLKKTVVEGEIIERSELPDPRESDYPNCRFTAHFKGNSIISGEPCPKEMVFVIEGFENYRIFETNNLKSGDKVECSIIPFDSLPEDYKSTQQADDLELFLLDNYYVVHASKIKTYSDNNNLIANSGIFFSDNEEEYISIFDRHINSDIPEEIQKAYEDQVRTDLKKMDRFLNEYDDKKIEKINLSFNEAWKKEKEKDPPNYNRIAEVVWRNINNSFWALPIDYTFLSKPDQMNQDILDCFASLKKVCETNGVHLIISIVPNLYDISSRVINLDFRDIPDIQTATYVKQLSEIGVESIYISDKIIQNYDKYPFAFFYPANSHPGDTTQDCISDELVERLRRYSIPENLNASLFSTKMEDTRIYNIPSTYLFPQNCDNGLYKENEKYECKHIYYNNAPIKINDKNSYIMIIGNSFIKSPMNASPDLALPSFMMYKLHSSIDWSWKSGQLTPLSDILVQLISNPESFLSGKKVLIMQIGVDHMKKAFSNNTMLNIAEVDKERLILNNKTLKANYILPTNTKTEDMNNTAIWGNLSSVNKTVLKVGENGKLTYTFKTTELYSLGNTLNDLDPIVCVVPYACTRTRQDIDNSTCRMIVNNISKTMQCSSAHFFNLSFELPAGTKEITIKVEGTPGTLFAIKSIQIWQ